MKRSVQIFLFLVSVGFLGSFDFLQQGGQLSSLARRIGKGIQYRVVGQDSYHPGEKVEYSVNYGMFGTIANASIRVESGLFTVNDRVCYKVRMKGKTKGTFTEKLGFRVDDTWISYIDNEAITSQRFFRYIAENKFRREEYLYLNPATNTARLKFEVFTVENKYKMPKESAEGPEYILAEADKKEVRKEDKQVVIPADKQDADGYYYMQDLISGYYYMRTLNFDKLKEGDVITIPAIFEEQTYSFRIVYGGLDEVKIKGKYIEAHKFIPDLSGFTDDLFRGQNPITFWVSADKNHIPLKAEAKIFLGAIDLTLEQHENLLHTAEGY
jgi:hypothetical protein